MEATTVYKIYRVPTINTEGLEKKIAKLSKRSAKLGCSPITIKRHGQVDEMVVERDSYTGRVIRRFVMIYDQVTVHGQAPKYEGWTFCGTLQHTENGNLLRAVPGETIPEAYRNVRPICDHCKSRRQRKDTYVVRNDQGDYKQVGRQCIADFLGHIDPENLARYATWLADAVASAEESEFFDRGSYQPTTYPIDYYMGYVAASIRTKGWLSRKMVEEYPDSYGNRLTTAWDAFTEMTYVPRRAGDRQRIEPIDEDHALAATTLTWAATLKDRVPTNDYQQNIAVIVANENVTSREAGLAASIIVAYKKDMELLEERQRQARIGEGSEYVGTVGKRQDFEDLTLVKVFDFVNDFGVLHILKFVDKDDNLLIWKTSTWTKLEEGDQVSLRGTVKDHSEYQGQKQTILTRCAIKA